MMRRSRVGLSVIAGIAVGLSSRPARAGEPACSRVSIETDGSLGDRSPELLKRAREAFEPREDIDRCARVILMLGDGAIDIEVVLADGRSAHRSVSRREDVVPVLEALLIVPQASPNRAGASSPSAGPAGVVSTVSAPARPPDSAAATSVSVPVREAPASMPAQPASHLRIELSAVMGARIGDGQASVGMGAVSFLDLSGWLVGFGGRADRYRMLTGADSGAALEVAVLGGRRFRFENIAVDLFGGPAAALQGTATFEKQATNNNQATNAAPGSAGNSCTPVSSGCVVSASSSSTVPRLLVSARLTFGGRSWLNTFVGVDGDVGPARAGDASGIPGASRLPIWTLGLALGATVGTQ
jgi:hypothetical protein